MANQLLAQARKIARLFAQAPDDQKRRRRVARDRRIGDFKQMRLPGQAGCLRHRLHGDVCSKRSAQIEQRKRVAHTPVR